MFSVRLENKAGQSLSFGMGSPFQIIDMSGLNPPPATINTSEVAMIDGAIFNSSKLQMRTLNVAFAITGDTARNRVAVYDVLKSKQPVRFYYKGEVRDVYIDGYVETIDISFFEMMQVVTASIVCPSPYFLEVGEQATEVTGVIPDFTAPFYSTAEPLIVFSHLSPDTFVSIPNDGDVECGMVIEMLAAGAVTNPKIYNYRTSEFIGVNASLVSGDLLTITTKQGHKTATLLHNGTASNVFNSVMQGSTWLQLPAEGGAFVYEVATGLASNLQVTIKHSNLFEGV